MAAKEQIVNWLMANLKEIQELILFIFIVTLGTMTKIIMEIKRGVKPSLSWFITEGILSFFVAITIYAVFDQFFNVGKFFSYVMCAWGGSLSSIFHEKMKDIVSALFDYVKVYLKAKITKNDSRQ